MRRLGLAALLAAVALGACSGGDDAALSLDDLRDTGDECPVDLAGSDLVADEVQAGEVEVEVTEGTGDGGAGDSAIDQSGGVYVECRTGGDDGTLAVVYASPHPSAMNLLLPRIQRDLDLTIEDVELLPAAFDDAGDGDLVELGSEGPVAAVRLDVDGAESGVLYLSTPVATPAEVADAAEEMVDRL